MLSTKKNPNMIAFCTLTFSVLKKKKKKKKKKKRKEKKRKN